MAELNLIFGPMFSGKTTHLINKVIDLQDNNINNNEILIINHVNDTRYDINKIYSHSGKYLNSLQLNNISTIVNNIINNNDNKIKYIFIDEGQFFNDLYIDILKLLKLDLIIYIYSLDGDFKQIPFNNSGIFNLIPYSTNIHKLLSKCNICNQNAPFTKRINNNSNEQILIGNNNFYIPVCFNHL